MDCPICYNLIENSCIGSCVHHFCYKCLIKWCHMGGTECPVCKKKIYEIQLDPEFDMINNPDKIFISLDCLKNITIDFDDKICPGITLKNNNSGPGVIIKNLNSNGKCYQSGLRKYDIILFVNKVPCVFHKNIIEIIDTAYKLEKSVSFEILQKK